MHGVKRSFHLETLQKLPNKILDFPYWWQSDKASQKC